MNSSCRIALGSAQFGMSYGVANQLGLPSISQVASILSYARKASIDTLDTAMDYGVAEKRLGKVGVTDWRIVSKLPALPMDVTDVRNWVKAKVAGSQQRLEVKHLYGLILHNPKDLLGSRSVALYEALQELKEQGQVKKIGLSIYNPNELEVILPFFSADLVQAPFNLLDRRLINSGWLTRLQEKGIEIHIRSVFLQGLLLMRSGSRPNYFQHWKTLWDHWHTWLERRQITPIEACLRFVLAQPAIDRIIVGVDNLNQLKEIVNITSESLPPIPEDFCTDDLDLINPSRWKI